MKKSESSDDQELLDMVIKASNEVYDGKVALVGKEAWQEFERNVLLQFLDQHWREHLSQLDMLRQGIHLRGYAQKQPKQEYKREAFELFSALLQTVGEDVTRVLMNVQIRQPTPEEQAQQQAMQAQEAHVDESEGQLKGPMFEQEAEEAEKFAHVGEMILARAEAARSSKTATEN